MTRAEPKTTVQTIGPIGDPIFPAIAGKGGHRSDHLLVGQPIFKGKLVVAEAGIGLPYPDHAVKHELSVPSSIQGEIVFFQLIGQR